MHSARRRGRIVIIMPDIKTSLQQSIIFLLGPTASGKTRIGVELAKRVDGEIISCDSMQVYQGLPIATNQPSIEQMAGIPHHLISYVSLETVFDVGAFHAMALDKIQEIRCRGRIPIIVGGSGMYAAVLLDGLFSGGEVNGAVRKQLEERWDKGELECLYDELKGCDPEAAKRIHPNDAKRIIRALEVFHSTGKPISQWQKKRSGLWDTETVYLFAFDMERDALYERINQRTEKMFEEGLIEEIASLRDQEISRTAEAIIGIKEGRKYLSGDWTIEQAKEEMKKNTRRFAKRQLTWFRAEKRLQWIDIQKDSVSQDVCAQILDILKMRMADVK